MSWVSICNDCTRREECKSGKFKPVVIHDPDDCEGDECLDWEPKKREEKTNEND